LTSRTGTSAIDGGVFEDGRKLLPDFTLGSYEEILRLCQREAKIACVIMVSEEHDDVTEFKR
jgi:FAS-associated factor 2